MTAGGTYYTIKDDGAEWRCKDCDKLHKHSRVRVCENTETKKRTLLCLDCIDEEWLAAATCLGEL